MCVKIRKIVNAARKLVIIKESLIEFEILDYVVDNERHYVVDLSQSYCEYGG